MEVACPSRDQAMVNYTHTHTHTHTHSVNWKVLMEGKNVQEKYEAFLNKYNEGMQKYVPIYKVIHKYLS